MARHPPGIVSSFLGGVECVFWTFMLGSGFLDLVHQRQWLSLVLVSLVVAFVTLLVVFAARASRRTEERRKRVAGLHSKATVLLIAAHS